jgi:nucleoside-diphosphate-sugar epimerase
MRIAVTGATGFLGRYMVRHFAGSGDTCRCWYRPSSDRTGFEGLEDRVEWVPGELGDDAAARDLVAGCDAVVHAALQREGAAFQAEPDDLAAYVEANVVGTIRLIESARRAGAERFVFISSCAVHDVILEDRPLDEAHPLWPKSHYGASKAAVEKFVHSFGLGTGYGICALRPTGIYGLAHPPSDSRWYELVHEVAAGRTVYCEGGGKEVHAADVAKAAAVLLCADGIAGQAYNCCDRFISQWDVAHIAKRLSGSSAEITGRQTRPKHDIGTGKLRALGMEFGGEARLEETVTRLLEARK